MASTTEISRLFLKGAYKTINKEIEFKAQKMGFAPAKNIAILSSKTDTEAVHELGKACMVQLAKSTEKILGVLLPESPVKELALSQSSNVGKQDEGSICLLMHESNTIFALLLAVDLNPGIRTALLERGDTIKDVKITLKPTTSIPQAPSEPIFDELFGPAQTGSKSVEKSGPYAEERDQHLSDTGTGSSGVPISHGAPNVSKGASNSLEILFGADDDDGSDLDADVSSYRNITERIDAALGNTKAQSRSTKELREEAKILTAVRRMLTEIKEVEARTNTSLDPKSKAEEMMKVLIGMAKTGESALHWMHFWKTVLRNWNLRPRQMPLSMMMRLSRQLC